MPHAYILRCSDESYYVGSTVDLDGRLWQHNTPDLGPLYTRRRRPVVLVWSAWFDSVAEAFAFEKRVQGWSRKKREALIRGDFEALPALSRRAAVQAKVAEGERRAPTAAECEERAGDGRVSMVEVRGAPATSLETW